MFDSLKASWRRRPSAWGTAAGLAGLTLVIVYLSWGSLAVKPLEFRTELVQRIAPETLEQCIDNLPDFQDVGWVQGSFPGGVGDKLSYDYAFKMTPRLNRVRKILQEARERPAAVTPLLEGKLADAVKGFDQAFQQMIEQMKHNPTFDKPSEFDRKCSISQAAVYLLAELKSYSSLPLLARVYEREGLLPVNRVFVYYAMHTLVLDHPRDALSARAVQHLDEYLALTKKEVPPPKKLVVAAWNAPIEESDFRITIAKQDIGQNRQPQIELHQYPYLPMCHWDLFDFSIGKQYVDPKCQGYFLKLRKFTDLAYP